MNRTTGILLEDLLDQTNDGKLKQLIGAIDYAIQFAHQFISLDLWTSASSSNLWPF